MNDCALRDGRCEEPEPEGGGWRYRVIAAEIGVVVEFESKDQLIVITAWRIGGTR